METHVTTAHDQMMLVQEDAFNANMKIDMVTKRMDRYAGRIDKFNIMAD